MQAPWHLNISSVSRHPLFPGAERTRDALFMLVAVFGQETAEFCIVDDHLHIVLVCDEATIERRRRALTRCVRRLAAVEVNPTHVVRIDSRRHMQTVFAYVLRQPAKHGLPVHPALWEGGCFPDLAGARSLPGLQLRIMEALPRATLRDAFEAVGLPTGHLEPASLTEARAMGAQRIITAATAACAASPGLRGLGHREATARRAACRLARTAGVPKSELAWLLAVTPRAVNRMAAHPDGARLVPCVLMRLALEERVLGAR